MISMNSLHDMAIIMHNRWSEALINETIIIANQWQGKTPWEVMSQKTWEELIPSASPQTWSFIFIKKKKSDMFHKSLCRGFTSNVPLASVAAFDWKTILPKDSKLPKTLHQQDMINISNIWQYFKANLEFIQCIELFSYSVITESVTSRHSDHYCVFFFHLIKRDALLFWGNHFVCYNTDNYENVQRQTRLQTLRRGLEV